VTDEVGLEDYRVSVGIGIRLYIPQFGPAPLAFDFAVPIVKEETDESQTFSFSAEIPF
jgi:outer membrane protein insertion porin family